MILLGVNGGFKMKNCQAKLHKRLKAAVRILFQTISSKKAVFTFEKRAELNPTRD